MSCLYGIFLSKRYCNVTKYIDRLFNAVRPRKLMYIAIDGVAPRAKMNQQRARRFRSAQEAREKHEAAYDLFQSLASQGLFSEEVSEQVKPKPLGDQFDSNTITPGTKFMYGLSGHLKKYIAKKLQNDKAWQDIIVLFSDASAPGEGEHKIMSFVRAQRSQPGYNPNTVHVLHGLDADLIMLALATHEVHFYILREEVLFGRKGAEQSANRKATNGFSDKQKLLDERAGCSGKKLPPEYEKPLQRLSVPILREYLKIEFGPIENTLPYEYNFETVIDDIVFFTIFVGNDFLPHLPSLDIRDGALDFLFNVYKRLLPALPVPYLTNEGGGVNLACVDVILGEVGKIESYVFKMRHEQEESEKQRHAHLANLRKNRQTDGAVLKRHQENGKPEKHTVAGRASKILMANGDKVKIKKATKKGKEENLKALERLKAELSNSQTSVPKVDANGNAGRQDDHINNTSQVPPKEGDGDNKADTNVYEGLGRATTNQPLQTLEESKAVFNEKLAEAERTKRDEHAANFVDTIKLHEPNYKLRYYTDKCKAAELNGKREELYCSYITGLCWVMKYYYKGCPSWKWYFPFHYAPFASDLINIDRFSSNVTETFQKNSKDEPFRPYEQLLSVLPSSSAHALPKSLQSLMLHPDSPIIDFYPEDVPVDPNGKAMPWLWVVLLPFIDESRLLEAMSGKMDEFSVDEKKRTAVMGGECALFVHQGHRLSEAVLQMAVGPRSLAHNNAALRKRQSLGDATRWGGFTGYIHSESKGLVCTNNSEENDLDDMEEKVHAVVFDNPRCTKHRSTLLRGAKPPPSVFKTPSEVRIGRPRLNRGGSIAFMGAAAMPNPNLGPPPPVQSQPAKVGFYQRNNPFQAPQQLWNVYPPQQQRQNNYPPPPPLQQQQRGFQFNRNNANYFSRPPPPPPPPPPPSSSSSGHRQGFQFRPNQNYNINQARPVQPPRQQQRIEDLRNQLRNTLQQHKRNGGANNNENNSYKRHKH